IHFKGDIFYSNEFLALLAALYREKFHQFLGALCMHLKCFIYIFKFYLNLFHTKPSFKLHYNCVLRYFCCDISIYVCDISIYVVDISIFTEISAFLMWISAFLM